MSRFQEHDDLLEDVLAEFRARGFRVIHLNRKPIPDAIAVKGDKTVMIDVTSSNCKGTKYSKRWKYQKYGFETDDLIIIAKNLPSVAKIPPEAYYYALELRKKSYPYAQIQKELETKFKVKISIPSLCRYFKGDVKPLSVRNTER